MKKLIKPDINIVPRMTIDDLRTQDEILAAWNGKSKPLVSISCITYNHELYIEDTLKGFLIQETNFPFEILLHDDASTDRTADIIREYEARYPAIIKPVYQIENQHSKGVRISATFNYPRALGIYVALCEGDDFWISPTKLKDQVSTLSRYSGVDLCFHSAIAIRGHEQMIIASYGESEKVFSAECVIAGGGEFIPTASILLRSRCLRGVESFHKLFPGAPVGDQVIQTIGAEKSGALYVPLIASVYRQKAKGSWSYNMVNNPEAYGRWADRIIDMYLNLDVHLSHRYHRTLLKRAAAVLITIVTGGQASIDTKRKLLQRYTGLFGPIPFGFLRASISMSRILRCRHVERVARVLTRIFLLRLFRSCQSGGNCLRENGVTPKKPT